MERSNVIRCAAIIIHELSARRFDLPSRERDDRARFIVLACCLLVLAIIVHAFRAWRSARRVSAVMAYLKAARTRTSADHELRARRFARPSGMNASARLTIWPCSTCTLVAPAHELKARRSLRRVMAVSTRLSRRSIVTRRSAISLHELSARRRARPAGDRDTNAWRSSLARPIFSYTAAAHELKPRRSARILSAPKACIKAARTRTRAAHELRARRFARPSGMNASARLTMRPCSDCTLEAPLHELKASRSLRFVMAASTRLSRRSMITRRRHIALHELSARRSVRILSAPKAYLKAARACTNAVQELRARRVALPCGESDAPSRCSLCELADAYTQLIHARRKPTFRKAVTPIRSRRRHCVRASAAAIQLLRQARTPWKRNAATARLILRSCSDLVVAAAIHAFKALRSLRLSADRFEPMNRWLMI